VLEAVRHVITSAIAGLRKETEVLQTLHAESEAALRRLRQRHPALNEMLRRAAGYVVFPSIGKAALLLGAAFGVGEVFERDGLTGYAAVAQLSLGVQVGGATFSQVIVFKTAAALQRFKQGQFAFGASASAVLIKASVAVSRGAGRDTTAFVLCKGGAMLEAALGVQKFYFRAAVLGRGKAVDRKDGQSSSSQQPTSADRSSRRGLGFRRSDSASARPAAARRQRHPAGASNGRGNGDRAARKARRARSNGG